MSTTLEALNVALDEIRRLKTRLWKRGFHCFELAKDIDASLAPAELDKALQKTFESDSNADELVYALLEFQLYTKWAPRLGVVQKDVLTPSSADIRQKLDDELTKALRPEDAEPSGTWNDVWEACLERWEEATSPPSDNNGHDGYRCPVQIERLTDVTKKKVNEGSDLNDFNADNGNVWHRFGPEDAGKIFSARDVSGWFPVGQEDTAFTADDVSQPNPYTPPAGMLDAAGMVNADWLYSRRPFARGVTWLVNKKPRDWGPVVIPWEGVELRPKILGDVDRERIKTDQRWASIFKIVRAVAQAESRASADMMQAYDDAYLSLPFFQNAAANQGEKPTPNELAGHLVWLEHEPNRPPDERKRFANLRLRPVSVSWTDTGNIGKDYETGSGEDRCNAQGAVSMLARPTDAMAYKASLDLLRRPHMVYRFAMHLRTVRTTRQAMWRFAVHRLRQLVWLRIPDREDVPVAWRDRPLGEIVRSELALTLILRYAVKRPGFIMSNNSGSREVYVATSVGKKKQHALLAWMKSAWSLANASEDQFEARLITLLEGKEKYFPAQNATGIVLPEEIGETPAKIAGVVEWHKNLGAFHLDASEVHGGLALQRTPGSSPFVKQVAGKWHLQDALDAWWTTADGHPPPAHAPTYLTPEGLRKKAEQIGIVPGLPTDAGKVAAPVEHAQITREIHAAASCGYARADNGNIINTQHAHQLKSHGAFNQRWSRLHLHDFLVHARRPALLCGTDNASPPSAKTALWRLDAQPDSTVYAFDARGGKDSPAVQLGRFDSAAKRAISLGDSATFSIPAGDPGQRTFRVFQAATAPAPAPDSFEITVDAKNLAIRWGTLRHTFPAGQAAKGTGASEIGLFLELLAWRAQSDHANAAVVWRYLRESGFDQLDRTQENQFFSFTPGLTPDPWFPWLAPRLWNPQDKQRKTPATNAEIGLALLSWPALHRLRSLLRDSALARTAMWDVWRIQFRGMLGSEIPGLGFTKPPRPRVFDLFQSEAALSALAYWAYTDGRSLKKALYSGAFGQKVRAWIRDNANRKDVPAWTNEDEVAVLWDFLVMQLPDGALRKHLIPLRPAVAPQRNYQPDLSTLIYLDGLEGTEWPGGGAVKTSGFLMVTPGTNQYGLALLTAALPSDAGTLATAASRLAALSGQNDGTTYWITGIAPVHAMAGAGLRGAAFMLPAPVQVSIKAGSAVSRIGLFAGGASPEEIVDIPQGELLSGFSAEIDITPWIGGLGNGVVLTLLVATDLTEQGYELRLGGRLGLPWLRTAIDYPLTRVAQIEDIVFDFSRRQVQWNFAAGKVLSSLPFRANGALELTLGLDNDLSPVASLSGRIDALEVQLGSPIASLGIRPAVQGENLTFTADLTADATSLELETPAAVSVTLRLELAAYSKAEGSTRVVPTLNVRPDAKPRASGEATPAALEDLLSPIVIDMGEVTATADRLYFAAGYPRVPAWLFSGSKPRPAMNAAKFAVLDIARQWFVQDVGQLLFSVAGNVSTDPSPQDLSLTLPLVFSIAGQGIDDVLVAETANVVARCSVASGYLVLRPEAFACELSSLELTFSVPDKARTISLASIAQVKLPQTLHAKLNFAGKDDALRFHDTLELRIPADGGFVFDLSDFSLGAAGVTLTGTVRQGQATISELPSLSSELNVRPASGTAGEIRIVRGRLVSASIAADARLRFFDDADGLLSLTLFQDQSDEGEIRLGASATFEVPLSRTFNVRALFLQFHVDTIQLSLRYSKGIWTAKGGMTGSVAFQPSANMEGRLQEYAQLFDGSSAHFENLDLERLGDATVRVLITPRTFEIASLFSVTLRGFEVHRIGALSLKSVGLLGDIAFKARLPNVRASLILGDIRLWQPKPDSWVPKIKISSLGISLALASGFQFKGQVVEYDDDKEYGFGGMAELETDAFPGTTVLVKLTRVRETGGGDFQPSFVVYAGADRTDSLAYGFFLRKLGIGAAGNQVLKGFSDDTGRKKAMGLRVEQALQNGIANPGLLESWEPVSPSDSDTYYSLVGLAQVSFGLMDRKTDHPFVMTMVLSIDEQLDIVAGINGWFIVSPDDSLTDDFIKAPALRGAIGLSPREQVLYGRFMTLKNPKFGPSASQNIVAKMLLQALNASQLSAAFYCDPRGALLEIGYPRQARYEISLGPAKGVAESGFRFGYYRGTHVVGLNLAISAEVTTGFSGDLGFANVELSARASFMLQASFAGALTQRGEMYVLADLTLSAVFEISAHLYKRIRIDGFWGSWTLTLFDLSGAVRVTATAAVSAALVPAGLGFDGSAEVALDVCGFHFGVRLNVASDPARVGEARSQIQILVPPIKDLLGQDQTQHQTRLSGVRGGIGQTKERPAPAHIGQLKEAVGLKAITAVGTIAPDKWCYHVRVVGDKTRVVLYPNSDSDAGYPQLPIATDGTVPVRRHMIVLTDAARNEFTGVVGSKACINGNTLEIVEPTEAVIIPKEYFRTEDGQALDLKARHLLCLPREHDRQGHTEEIIDPRTRFPVSGDFDDPAVLADPQRRSTRFNKRHRQFDTDPLTYDDHLLEAQRRTRTPAGVQKDAVLTDAELLTSLLQLAEDPHAAAKTEEAEGQLINGNWQANSKRLPALLGLVLEFAGVHWVDRIAHDGIRAIATTTRMFDEDIIPACWTAPTGLESEFRFEPQFSRWFQGQGEIGLSWQLTRVANSVEIRSGPESHRGVRHYLVRREVISGECRPGRFVVMPSWITYLDRPGGTRYYIRPQFQFIDRDLPLNRELRLRYVVQAIGPDLSSDPERSGVLKEEIFELVHYKPVQRHSTVVNAQTLLRLPDSQGHPASVEFLVGIDLAEWPDEFSAIRKQLAGRIDVHARPVLPGNSGRYGASNETDITLEWREELQGSELKLPQPVESRRMAQNSLMDARPVSFLTGKWRLLDEVEVEKRWEKRKEKEKKENNRFIVFQAVVVFTADTDMIWQNLMGGGGTAATEYYVRLKALDSDDGVTEVATPFQRMRLAITSQTSMVDLKTGLSTPDRQETLFTEGREIAALERFPVDKPTRAREWLTSKDVQVKVDIRPGANATRDDIEVRLNGEVRHDVQRGDASQKAYGPPVAYRVWAGDVLDRIDHPDDPVRLQVVRSFSVLPEKAYRALPGQVIVKHVPETATPLQGGEVDWQFETPRIGVRVEKSEPFGADKGTIEKLFATAEFHGGASGAIHRAIYDYAQSLTGSGPARRVSLSVNEYLVPPPADGTPVDRAARLLERAPESVDAFGWRLLEGMGVSATIWVEADDDRLPPAQWACLAKNVAIIEFEKIPPRDRVGHHDLTLYSVRVFAVEVLQQLYSIATEPQKQIHQFLEQSNGSRPLTAIEHALRWLSPVADPGPNPPKSWFDLLVAAATRCTRFLDTASDSTQRSIARMWKTASPRAPAGASGNSSGNAGPNGDYATSDNTEAVLPAVDGMVKFFVAIGEGYASDWRLAVEVIRRYDLKDELHDTAPHLKNAQDDPPTVRAEVPRTIAMQPDLTRMLVTPEDGGIDALVRMHPAQRAHLYRAALSRRVQFSHQAVELQRAISAHVQHSKFIFEDLADALDWEALEASWESNDATERATADWCADASLPSGRRITRGHNTWRYPFLPPNYDWRVAVVSQAGIRRSDDTRQRSGAAFAVSPMFERPADGAAPRGLQYRDLGFMWRVEDDELSLLIPFARATDALPQQLQAYWAAIDRVWVPPVTNAQPVPILQLPDLLAQYIIMAQSNDGSAQAELFRIQVNQHGRVEAELQVSPYDKLNPAFHQFDAGSPWPGRLGVRCTINVAAPELAWLARSLQSETPDWILQCVLQRDGVRFRMAEVV